MSSLLSSKGVAFATAMAALSGTVIFLSFCLQKSIPTTTTTQFTVHNISLSSPPVLRSCLSSDGKRREKKKKRVQFAEDVVNPSGDGEDFRKKYGITSNNSSSSSSTRREFKKSGDHENGGIPANRMALYNGILRDRGVHRLAYSH